jgi:RHS repeat-associated protein
MRIPPFKSRRPLGIFCSALVLATAGILATSHASSAAGASGQLLIDHLDESPSGALNLPYAWNTVTFNYNGGTVTFTSCKDQACTWAIDDAAQLVVTRPNGSQITRDFTSDTKDKPAQNVTDMFQVGANSVTTNLIDHFGPARGLPRALYLVESTGSLPPPTPPVVSLPTTKKYNNNPYARTSKDPVNTYTGAYLYHHEDTAIRGRGPAIDLVRSYDGSDPTSGAMGPGWTHNYAMQIVRPDDTTSDLVVISPEGRADRFTYNSGTFAAPAGIYTTLVKNSDNTFTVIQKDRTTWSFNESGVLTRLTDRYGNQSTLSYDTGGRLMSVSDPAGRGSLVFGYDGAGRINAATDWSGRVVHYGYDVLGRLTAVTDRENQTITYGYEGTSSRLATMTDSRGNVAVTNTYDGQGRVVTQKDARGLTTGQQTSFAYNTNADNTKTTVVTYPKISADPTWNFTEEDTYDPQGRVIKKVSKPLSTSADWVTQQYGYDASGNRGSYQDGRGNTTLYCYDTDYAGVAVPGSRGNLTRTISPAPVTGMNPLVTLVKYDNKDNVIQAVSPRGVANSATVTCATNLSSGVNTNYAVDSTFDTATQTQLIATTKRFTDPTLGLQTATTKYEYGDAANPGLITRIITPRGNTTGTPDYTYATTSSYFGSGSKASMLASTTTPAGAVTTYDYDSVGRKTSMVDPNGNLSGATPADHTWQYVYDNEDRLRFNKQPAPAAGGALLVTETRYDGNGNKAVAIDAKGQVTRYLYDERDQLQEVQQNPNTWTDPSTTPSGTILTDYQYDNLGNLIRIIRAKGSTDERATDYAFDGLSRIRSETRYPNWPTTTPTLVTAYTYDLSSNTLTRTDANANTTSYIYDALNRLTKQTYPGAASVSFTYDGNGNKASMVDTVGTTTFAYDSLDRLTQTRDDYSHATSYTYDTDNNQKTLTYDDGSLVTYSYDKSDRLSSVLDWRGKTTSYTYKIDGSRATRTMPNGEVTTYAQDNDIRLKSVTHKLSTTTQAQFIYTRDANGSVVSAAESGSFISTTPQSSTFTYDRMGRITNATYPGGNTYAYAYDRVGNMITEDVVNQPPFSDTFTRAYTYDKDDRMSQVVVTQYGSPTTYTHFSYDNNGNMTKKPSENFNPDPIYSYDFENRMVGHTTAAGNAYTYTYDGMGNRLQKYFSTAVERYVTDMSGSLPKTIAIASGYGGGGIIEKFLYGVGPIYDDAANRYYLEDGLGNIRFMANSTGTSATKVMYDPFGNLRSSANANDIEFQGQWFDDENSQYFLRARYYDPAIGRFISRDTFAGDIQQPQSLNRYTYVQNNPVNYIDPSGHVMWGQVEQGALQTLGGAAEAIAGGGVLYATGWTGVGAMGGFTLMGVGEFDAVGGIAMVGSAFQDRRLQAPSAIGTVASSITSNPYALDAVAILAPVFTGGGNPFTEGTAMYRLLERLNSLGDVHDTQNLWQYYQKYMSNPSPAYAPTASRRGSD